jgi:transposase-like protein
VILGAGALRYARARMGNISTVSVRRSRAEWQRLVRQWQRNGRSAREFASEHGVNLRTLTWWKWRLGGSEPTAARHEGSSPAEIGVRFLPVEVDSTSDVGWELVTKAGDRLTARGPLSGADLVAVLGALVRSGRRR